MQESRFPPVSVVKAAASSRCPRCGEGPLYDGFLKVADRCSVCGLRLSVHDAGDGPAVFVILILGFVVVGLAFAVEASFAPPMWVHALLWPPLVLGASLGMLRFVKSLLIALQYRHRAEDYHVAD
jgi:uncharacterized protein (DUF983 family)